MGDARSKPARGVMDAHAHSSAMIRGLRGAETTGQSVPRREGVGGIGDGAPRVLNLGNSQGVCLTTRLVCPRKETSCGSTIRYLTSCKGKVVTVPFSLTEHHATKAYLGSGGVSPRIFTSALDGDEWSLSRP
jgi:hypothetical protein